MFPLHPHLRSSTGTGVALLALAVFSHTAFASDAAVKDAAEGFRFGESKRVNAALAQARGHLLEHYVEYWALRLRIDTASAAEIERFLRATAGTAVGDRMRVDWLKQLGRTGDWARFEQVGQGFDTDDSEIACLRATWAVRNGAKEVQPVPRGIWEDRLTEACADAFAALVRAKQL